MPLKLALRPSSPRGAFGLAVLSGGCSLLGACVQYQVGSADKGVVDGGEEPAGAPALEVTPTAVDFGGIPLGDAPEAVLTVTNVGTDTLVLGEASLVNGAAPFTITLPEGRELEPGGAASLVVRFAPTDHGEWSSALDIASNDPVLPSLGVPVSGRTLAPALAVEPSYHDFGDLVVGEASESLTITLSSVGEAPLTVTEIRYAATGAGLGLDDDTAPGVLNPGESAEVVVTFAPVALGGVEGVLTVVSDDPRAPESAASQVGQGVEAPACWDAVTCTHPSAARLGSAAPAGASDIQFDADCVAFVPTIVSGTDHVVSIDTSGVVATLTGYSDYNIQSVAVEPGTGRVAVSHNNNSSSGIGMADRADTSIRPVASGSYNSGDLWSNTWMNGSSGSLVWDPSGCVWAPGFAGAGSLSCVDPSGGSTELLRRLDHIESVALSDDGLLVVSVWGDVLTVDQSSGSLALLYTAGGNVLDLAFDCEGNLYVEHDAGAIDRIPADGGAPSRFATVTGQGRLAVSPDGWLVRIAPNPTSSATWQEWEL